MKSDCMAFNILREQARDFAGEEQAEGDGRQNHVPRRFPQADGQQFPFDGEKQDQQRRDDKSGHANGQRGQKTAGIIRPSPAPGCGEKTDRQPDAHRKPERQGAEQHGDRQSLCDDVIDRMIAIFERDTEVAVRQIAQVAEVLFPDRFIEMIFRLQGALDFRRRRRALAVKRPAGSEMHQGKRQRADDQQQRNGEDDALEKIHFISGPTLFLV